MKPESNDELLIAEINKLHDRLEQMQKANAYGEHLNHKLALRVAELEAENAKPLAHRTELP